MNNSKVKGTTDELLGSAKQEVGKLTGDSTLQVEGIIQQAKGNLENAWGNAKDVVNEANEKPEA
jgi:uncharacterized protein YjbJ (UPF0337 family)